MPTAFGLAVGMPQRTSASGGVASPDTVQFTARSNNLSRSTSSLSGSYTRAYGSLWVSLPAGDVDANMVIGIAIEDTSFTKNFVYFCGLDPFASPTNYLHEFKVTTPAYVFPESVRKPDGSASVQWMNVLFEVDTTEAAPADRAKIYIGGTKQTPIDEISITQNASITLGTGPHTIYVASQSTAQFGIVDATALVRAVWVKFATTNLFDFDNATDRQNFISASRGYVTHQATMGGQTADFWGAGDVTAWTGGGWTNSGGTSVVVGGITSILG